MSEQVFECDQPLDLVGTCFRPLGGLFQGIDDLHQVVPALWRGVALDALLVEPFVMGAALLQNVLGDQIRVHQDFRAARQAAHVAAAHRINELHPFLQFHGWQGAQHRHQPVEVGHACMACPEGVGRVLVVLIVDEPADGLGITGVEQGVFRGVGWCHARTSHMVSARSWHPRVEVEKFFVFMWDGSREPPEP